jgi:hypothetical protein
MEELMYELAVRGYCVVIIFLYGQSFYVSRLGGRINDLWFYIGSEAALGSKTIIRSSEDLVEFVRKYVPDAPKDDQMIVLDFQNAVSKALRDKEI